MRAENVSPQRCPLSTAIRKYPEPELSKLGHFVRSRGTRRVAVGRVEDYFYATFGADKNIDHELESLPTIVFRRGRMTEFHCLVFHARFPRLSQLYEAVENHAVKSRHASCSFRNTGRKLTTSTANRPHRRLSNGRSRNRSWEPASSRGFLLFPFFPGECRSLVLKLQQHEQVGP